MQNEGASQANTQNIAQLQQAIHDMQQQHLMHERCFVAQEDTRRRNNLKIRGVLEEIPE
ncbi:Hypothetical predicted protein, partial [Pelobates cultripes]